MEKNYIEVNDCKHYVVNEAGAEKQSLLNCDFSCEKDEHTTHPFGNVYKTKKCNNTNVRFVKDFSNQIFMFNLNEWHNKNNPFSHKYKQKTFFSLINLF